jgi:hypothetical protein
MAMHRSPFRPAALAAVLCGATALSAFPRDARADEISPNGKGIVGGGLLGAEVITLVEGVAGVRAGWAYWLGAIVGAGGGAVGGYAVEKAVNGDGTVPMAMLAGGMALIIPALVVSLDATRFRPDEGATEDNPPGALGPAADPGAAGGSVVGAPPPATMSAPPGSTSPPPPPQSLLDIHTGDAPREGGKDWDVRVGVPVPNVRPVFSLAEQRQYGMRAETEVRMPVLHVTF